MSNITVSASLSNISVDSTTNNVTVSSNTTTTTVGDFVSNAIIRSGISNVEPIAYSTSTGVIGWSGKTDIPITGNITQTGHITVTGNISTTDDITSTGNIAVEDGSKYLKGNLTSRPSTSLTIEGLSGDADISSATNVTIRGRSNTLHAPAIIIDGTGSDSGFNRGNIFLDLPVAGGSGSTADSKLNIRGYEQTTDSGPYTYKDVVSIIPGNVLSSSSNAISNAAVLLGRQNNTFPGYSNSTWIFWRDLQDNEFSSARVNIQSDLNVKGHLLPNNTPNASSPGFGQKITQSTKQQMLGRSQNAWFKKYAKHDFSDRMYLTNSGSMDSGETMSGLVSQSNAAVLHFTGDQSGATPRIRTGITADWYLQNSPNEEQNPTLTSDSGVLLDNRNDFTTSGSYDIRGDWDFSGLFNSTGNITTTANVTAGNIATTGIITAGASATDTHTFTGNIDVTGNIEVSGNLNYRNVEDLYVRDQSITLNANAASDATVSIIANRPQAGANTVLRWNETSDIWEFTNDGSTYYPIPTSTSDLAEGTNLYYTDARVNTYINSNNSAEFNQVKVHNLVIKDGPAGNDVYKFGANSASNNQFLVYDGTQFKPTTPTTSIVNEGTNLYYTTDRANSAIGAYQGNISTAGTITATGDITTSGFFEGDLNGAVTADVYNNTGGTLTKGQAVYLTGANTGDNPHVALADADDATKMPALGIVRENISTASVGQVVTSGVMNFASHGFALGSDLFIGTTAGGLSITAPTGESGLIQKIGKVVSSNHIIVQGAFRTNATPNLNQGKIFLGDTNNQTLSVTPSTNFKTTGNAFEIANALTNVNSIQSESANDKFSFKALLGADNTSTLSGNITSDGYEVIIDSSHTYDSAGNIAQSGTNNLNGYAVSGVFTAGSNVMTLTGVTELKNVYAGAGNITGANNNVSLTGDMVAGMIPDQYYTASVGAEGGDQYPLPQGTTLVSANTTALVFSESALANVTAANATNAAQGPFAIMHGGKDATTGQLISFLSQDDATPDGTTFQGVDTNSGYVALSDFGIPAAGNETNDTILVVNLGGAVAQLPTGTPVTFANVTGTGASNINGNTYYYGRDVFTDGTTFTLFSSADGTTTPVSMTSLGLVAYDTNGGDYSYSVAQSTSTISKARLYVEDTYGYPATGPTENDFTYTVGSASDYNVDMTAATTSFRGRTSLEAPKQVLKAPIGLTIGENTTMSNRGDGDALTNFGLNFVWDGLTDYSTLYAGTTSNIVPQMLFKSYTDNTFASGASGKGRGGPRLFFAPSTGNINTSEFDKYPRASQELGRMTFWGPTQNGGDAMSTVNPPGFISATAQSDWTTSNKLDMHFAANGNGTNNADIFLTYTNGKVVIGSGSNGSTNEAIHFAPAVTTTTGNAAQQYATLGHTWANVNYANVSASTGSKLTITQGTTDANGTGDLTLAFDREYIAGLVTDTLATPLNGGFTTFGSSGIAGLITGNETSDTIIMQFADGGEPGLSVGQAITLSGVTGPGNGNLNGVTFYVGRVLFGSIVTLWTSADGTTTPALGATIGLDDAQVYTVGGTGNGTLSATVTGTAAKEWQISLDEGSDDLKIKSGATTQITITDTETKFATTAIPVLPSYSNVSLPGAGTAGGMIFVTNGNNKPAYSNGSAWLYTFDNSAVT